MGKKKKITKKVKTYYRGVVAEPTKIANEQETNEIIVPILKNRADNFIKVGLRSTLRCLKQRKAKAIIYDNTASPHLKTFLIESAKITDVPIVEAHQLINITSSLNLNTLLAFTISELPPQTQAPHPILQLWKWIQTNHRPNAKEFELPIIETHIICDKK